MNKVYLSQNISNRAFALACSFFLLCSNIHVIAQSTTFGYTGTIGSYTVPAGVYLLTISASGAQGGNQTYTPENGGDGATMAGNIPVIPGHVLNYLVGQQPASAAFDGGGGGGSFVWDVTAGNVLLVAAGGGGGASIELRFNYGGTFLGATGGAAYIGLNASTTANGVNGGNTTSGAGTGGGGSITPGGIPGLVTDVYGAGGAGWTAGGAAGYGSVIGICGGIDATGGLDPLAGGAGGIGATAEAGENGNGGYGGGGGAEGYCSNGGGGGGGGYSGGGGGGLNYTQPGYDALKGGPGGGGGSYMIGTATGTTSSTTHTGNGTITICAWPSVGVVTVSPSTSICTGGTATLNTSGTASGTWSSTSVGVATITGTTVTGVGVGTSVISFTATNVCGTTAATATVNVTAGAGTIDGNTPICVTGSTILTDAAAGGTWSYTGGITLTGTTGTTSTVTGVTVGTGTVTYTTPGGCYTDIIVTVNAEPSTISDNTPICQTFSITLSDATTGGTWSSTSGTITVGSSSGSVTGSGATGTSTVTYAIGSCYVTTIVTVNTQPGIINGTTSVCDGFTISLTDGTGGGVWSSSITSVAGVGTDGTVTGNGVGTAIITYMIGSCYVTQEVTVNTQPVSITGNTGPICATNTLTLSDATTGGTWSVSNGNATIGTGSGIVTGVSPVLDTVTYSMSTGCAATTVVTINPLPATISGTLDVCSGLTTTLTDASAPGAWSSSSTIIAVGSVTGVVTGETVAITSTATITYTLPTGCYTTAVVTVNPLPGSINGALSVCVGSDVTLTDAAAGGTWSLSNGNAIIGSGTGTATGVTPGLDTVTYTLSTGCLITAVLTVDPLPTAILGTLTVCSGSSTTLSDAGGGTWTSSNTSVAIVGSASGVVTGETVAITSTATITYTIGTGCSTTAIVTVYPLPTAILGDMNVCLGLTTTLSDATGGGTWSSANTSVSTIGSATGIADGGAVGTSMITYMLSSTGCFITSVLTVNPLPTAILGNLTVCSGLTTTLSDAGGGTWSSSNTAVAIVGVTTGIVTGETVAVTSTATITYTLPTTCIITAIVTVNPLPTAIQGTLDVCSGLTTTLSDAGGGTWISSNTTVAAIGSTTGIVTAGTVTTATTVTITYTLPTGCQITAIVTVNPLPTAILGNLSVCSGLTTTLSDAGGGTWSSSNTTIAAIGSTTGVVTGGTVTTATTATITYTLPTGCIITAIVTVDPLPTTILGTLDVCSGLTTTLSDAGGGTWSSSNTAIATVGSTTGIVTGETVAVTSTATITYTLGTGCIETAVVTVNPLPATITGSLDVCVGLTTALNDGTGGGTWSSSNTAVGSISTTGIVTGISGGTTTIIYVLPTGCLMTAIVTVNPLPTAISGTKTVCSGSTTDLGDTPGSGTWSSSNTAVATVGASTGVVTGQTVIVATTVTITYTLATGCYMTTTVTVNPLPTAILGANNVCLGSTVTLSDAGGGTWSSANLLIATVGSATGIVTGVGVGVTTITYKLATGCYITAPMTVNPLPVAITGPTVVCPFASITLNDGSGGGSWTSSNTAVATVGLTTGIVTGVISTGGTATITYTLGTGCYVTYAITVNPAPVPLITPVGDTTFCPGGFVALTANTGAGLSYQWYVGGVAITGALSSSYITTLTGSYQVFETNSFGCSTMSIPMQVTVATPTATITATSSTTICAGSSITLDANTGAGLSYQWLLGGVAITGATGATLTTNIAGNYDVVVTNATGCSATSNVITVDTISSPTANVTLSGPLTFCQGSSVVMTTDFALGYTYQWYLGGVAIAGATNQSYTATATGTYYVIVTNTNGCTATSINISVVVNPLPNVAITASGATLFCAGGSVTLSATAVAGDTYQWYMGGSAIAGATNSSYLVTASGGYEVQITDPTTGCSAQTLADTTVTVVATPVIVPVTPASFCWGGSALLSTSLSGASGTVTYQWYFNGVAIPGATGPTYDAATPGSYSCQINIPGSCTVTTVAIPVTEFPLPNPIVTFDGAYFQTGNYYVTYQWYKNLVAIAGATTSSTPCTGAGDYKVDVTDTNGCQSYSDVYVDTTCTLSGGGGGTTAVPNVNNSGIKIYPNPAQTMVHIESAVQVRAVINSIDGRSVLNIDAAKDINISSLADGIYMIMLYDDNGIMVKVEKLVKTTN